jgi:hypothetical protein
MYAIYCLVICAASGNQNVIAPHDLPPPTSLMPAFIERPYERVERVFVSYSLTHLSPVSVKEDGRLREHQGASLNVIPTEDVSDFEGGSRSLTFP